MTRYITRREAFEVLFEGDSGWASDEQLDREFAKFEAERNLREASPDAQTGFVIQDALGIARRDHETVRETLVRAGMLDLATLTELACAVSDAWLRHPRSWDLDVPVGISKSFSSALTALELATRSRRPRPRDGETRKYREIVASDVGKALFEAFGRKWSVTEFIGRVMKQDIGKRVFLSDGILQVENDEQRARRLQRGREPSA